MTKKPYIALYDFEFYPFSLGDTVAWNIQTAIRAIEANRGRVDIYLCLDPSRPPNCFQRDFVSVDNMTLHLNEIFGAFGTHPMLGNILIYTSQEALLGALRQISEEDSLVKQVLADYEILISNRDDIGFCTSHFLNNVWSFHYVNQFAKNRGEIPLLKPSIGCEADIRDVRNILFRGRRVVVVHPRLRQLDSKLGGRGSYSRDSDFVEWYEFLRLSAKKHPDVSFVLVGRIQEKPLSMLKLPNVVSLRSLGLGLGHELTLLLQSDLFIGASSGFAAAAHFSKIPYYILKVTQNACESYGIKFGDERLPFASGRQFLNYENETTALLTKILGEALDSIPRRNEGTFLRKTEIDPESFERDRIVFPTSSGMTTRFFVDRDFMAHESAYLIWPKIIEAMEAERNGDRRSAMGIISKLVRNFPWLLPKFSLLKNLNDELSQNRYNIFRNIFDLATRFRRR